MEGEVVADGAAVLEEECRRYLEQHGELVVDLSELTFIDGRAAEVLRHLQSSSLKIVDCSPLVEELIAGGDPPDARRPARMSKGALRDPSACQTLACGALLLTHVTLHAAGEPSGRTEQPGASAAVREIEVVAGPLRVRAGHHRGRRR